MSLIDLLRMSGGNLKRRKLRTFLTVLGVIIGTASIVVMISLGLGLQKSMYDEIEKSGGLTEIEVMSKNMWGMDQGSSEEQILLTDEIVKDLAGLEHVEYASPVLNISAIALKGNYEGWIDINGLSHEALEAMDIPLKEGGRLPAQNSGTLEFIYGNTVIQNFHNKSGGGGYWDTGELPDIDLENDSLFVILDQDAYYQSGSNVPGGEGDNAPPRVAKKFVVKASGVVEGTIDDWNQFSYATYCDLDTLKNVLTKEFKGRAIPGQPTQKNGKPYKYFVYNSAKVKVDDFNNVEAVSNKIREMGFETYSNAEWVESMKTQSAMIQAVLGGIGAISLLVAAIGIANTMMMSIYERTREIGVIKVLGCDMKNIKQMFLMEAGFIGLIGGVVGNICSLIISLVINQVASGFGASMGVSGGISYIPVWLILVSMGFATFVGMAAGYFPALRAMRLSPLAAIRNE